MNKCKVTSSFYDFQKVEYEEYICPHQALDSGYCKFHDSEYHQTHEKEVVELFLEHVEKAISNNTNLLCIDFHLPGFEMEKEFTCKVNFDGATFHGDVHFKESKFNTYANFVNATFEGNVKFSSVKEFQEASFFGSVFKQLADFSDTSFKRVDFGHVKFEETADFSGTTFHRKLVFAQSKFKEHAYFSRCIFEKIADFSDVEFQKFAAFDQSTFHNETRFPKTQFSGEVNFCQTKFSESEGTYFTDAKFVSKNMVTFENAEFGGVSFENAQFSSSKVLFNGARFGGNSIVSQILVKPIQKIGVDFRGAFFQAEEVSFRGAQFGNEEWQIRFDEADFDAQRVVFIDCTFYGRVSLAKTKFANKNANDSNSQSDGVRVHFSNTIFDGAKTVSFFSIDFVGAVLAFHGTNFKSNSVFFDNSVLNASEGISFQGAKFDGNGWISFREAKFCGDGRDDFFGTRLYGKEVDFTEAQFTGKGSVFFDGEFRSDEISFTKTVFSKSETSFSKAEFIGNVYFKESAFKKPVSFNETQFGVETDFSMTNFDEEVSFRMAQFDGMTSFFKVKFSRADFLDSIFKGKTFFSRTKFNGEALFDSAQFSDNVSFSETKFNGNETNFTNAKFAGEKSTFEKAEFDCNGLIDFRKIKCYNEIIFNDCLFTNNVAFNGADFKDDTRFIDTKFLELALFRNVFFKNPRDVYFDGESIDRVSFLYTDISSIRLGIKSKRKLKETNYKIYEESIIRGNTSEEKIPLSGVLALYRNLRENFEYDMEYEEAGQLFIREMNLKRAFKPNRYDRPIEKRDWFSRNFFATGLYYWTSKYGEDFKRPVIITASAIFVATVFFLYFGYEDTPIGALERSAKAFSPTFDLPETTSDTSKALTAVDYLLKVIFLPIAATIFIALRRRLERRFRH